VQIQRQENVVQMRQHTFSVTGMSCASCEARVKKALERVEGVRGVTADHVSGQVRVMFDEERVEESTLVNSIKNAGYGASS